MLSRSQWGPSASRVFAAIVLVAPLVDAAPRAFIEANCIDCHDADDPKADFSLADLDQVDSDGWQQVFEQVATDEMPPKKRKKARPTLDEREEVLAWIGAKLRAEGIAVHRPSGPRPEDGNLLDHELLFSGRIEGPASSPPRFWRRSQMQYDALMEQLWVIPKLRYEKAASRDDPEWAAYSYSKPFPALDPESFRDYASEVHADEAALRALMNAGSQIAERLTAEAPSYAKEIQPWAQAGVPHVRRNDPWTRFSIDPPKRAAEFEPFLGDASVTEAERSAAVCYVFGLFMDRPATADEEQRYGALLERCITKSDPVGGLRGLITAVMVSPEFVFRMEVGMGERDEHGRRMLSPNELVYAIAYALTDGGPDAALRKAADEGRLATRADVERELRRILADGSIEKGRRLRFFQEFFGYHRAGEVFKDKGGWEHEVKYLVRDADQLVEHVLAKDRDVFAELLTAERYFVAYPTLDDPELLDAVIARTIEETKGGIEKTLARGKEIGPNKQGRYSRTWAHQQGRALIPRTVHNDRSSAELSYISVYGFDGNAFEWSRKQPIDVPGKRAGILTHPAWLIAHSSNFDNDVVGRGHWIREHLLAGRIPDVPIEVEAMVPEEPDSTLRERMRVTREAYCLRCHTRMDPLGFPFEMYDHYGHYRTEERVGVRKNVPKAIDTSGEIFVSGEAALDGPVEDAIELVHKLAKSPRVRQSFVRHAFRYWMGRNEQLSDSPVLIAADRAYVDSGGSFSELLVSLMTSDAFLYRK